MKTLQEILARRAEIKKTIQERGSELSLEEIKNYQAELTQLDEDEVKARAKQELDEQVTRGTQPVTTEARGGQSTNQTQTPEQRAAEAKAKRGAMYKMRSGMEISLRSSVEGSAQEGVLIPSHLDRNVDAFPWNEVSSVIDLVDVIPLTSGSDYTHPFQITTGEGDYTLEATTTGGGDDGVYHEVGTTFDQVTIKRNKITALTYMSEELEALPDADYAGLVEKNVSLAIKKKLAKEIMIGNGTTNHFVGLAVKTSESLNANTYTDKDYAIDENTLMDMMVDYGGAEDVESRQVIVMNKLTIKDFARVRDTNKRKVYDIQISGNTFTIDGYRGVFSSHIKPFATAAQGDIWMVYGDLSQYKMLNFGGETIETSREFKFNQGITTIRGKVYAGGNIAGYKAVLRAKKPASASMGK